MNSLKKSIDYTLLERDLYKALRDEELYKLQNDAKFRAVEQDVPTYEHFRQMVNAAHLKSLSKTDLNKKANVSWNICTNSMNRNKSEILSQPDRNSILLENDLNLKEIPKTYDQFSQIWNKLENSREKLDFLYEIRDILKNNIFATEVPATFLSDFFILIYSLLTKNYSNIIIELLSIISKCKRFHLNLSFLTKEDKDLCRLIFQQIFQHVDEENKNEVLCLSENYEINID